ncbi:hypothetical protein Daus18300_010734 [Diaporthe australafricana]|uniref:Uncharacterized protein n=1 Tax=Diaporthe australafricana TaxID=127596 RepID=A0ABR3W9H5_9PEZI
MEFQVPHAGLFMNRDIRTDENMPAAFERFNGKQWVGKLHLQVAREALELLAKTRKQAERMLQGERLRRECSRSSCRCPIYTQFSLICANRIADKEEAGIPLDKDDVHLAWYLDRNLSINNPLLLVLSPKKVLNSRGRPRDNAPFTGDEEGIFGNVGRAVVTHQTSSNTRSLGSKAGDKTRATMASVQRVNSAFEWNDTTLESLADEDQAARRPKRRARGPALSAPPRMRTAPSTPPAKRRRTAAAATINGLPAVDLTATDVDEESDDPFLDGGDEGGDEGTTGKETQSQIIVVID